MPEGDPVQRLVEAASSLLTGREQANEAMRLMRPFSRRGFALRCVRGAVKPGAGKLMLPYPHVPYCWRRAYDDYTTRARRQKIMYTVLSFDTPIAWVDINGTKIFVDRDYGSDLRLSATMRRHLSMAKASLVIDYERCNAVEAGQREWSTRLWELRYPAEAAARRARDAEVAAAAERMEARGDTRQAPTVWEWGANVPIMQRMFDAAASRAARLPGQVPVPPSPPEYDPDPFPSEPDAGLQWRAVTGCGCTGCVGARRGE